MKRRREDEPEVTRGSPPTALRPSADDDGGQEDTVKAEADSDESVLRQKALMKAYFFEHGLRKVVPYEYSYKTFAKGRWLNRTIADVFTSEFADRPAPYYKAAILAGHITVNGQAVPLEYKFKNADELVHRVHRHEPAITDEPLTILERTARFLVVHKPSAMPCHPTGRYRLNSMLEILKTMGHEDVYLVNRLDRLTSGVLLLPFQKKDAVDLQQKILDFDVTKDGRLTVNEPILLLDSKMGLNRIDPKGKTAVTEFERESYNGRTSVVRCWPKTGRTHQIRIHLQHLGHPIVNDPLYHDPVFANATKDEEKIAHVAEQRTEGNATAEEMASLLALAETLKQHRVQKEGDFEDAASKELDLRICPDCSFPLPDPKPLDMVMWLHAFRYSCDEWSHESPWPDWAQADYDDRIALAWKKDAHDRMSMARMARERLQKHEKALMPSINHRMH